MNVNLSFLMKNGQYVKANFTQAAAQSVMGQFADSVTCPDPRVLKIENNNSLKCVIRCDEICSIAIVD